MKTATEIPAKKIFPMTLHKPDIENLLALQEFLTPKGQPQPSQGEVLRTALTLSMYYYGLKTAEQLDFYPPAFAGKKK